MVQTHCQRCDYEWEYGGQATHFCTCPRCSTSVKVGRSAEDDEGEQEQVEGNQQSPTGEPAGEPAEIQEPQVLLEVGGVDREVPITDAVVEIFETMNEIGATTEVRREEIEALRGDVQLLSEQVHEIATIFEEFVDEMGGEVEYESIGVDVPEEVEEADQDDVSVQDLLQQVGQDSGEGTYDPTEEFEG